MATGLPIITTPVGANKDMVEDKGGVIVPVGDVSSIVAALKQMSDKKTRESMSIWNMKKVENSYLIDRVMEKLLSIYAEVQNESRTNSTSDSRMLP